MRGRRTSRISALAQRCPRHRHLAKRDRPSCRCRRPIHSKFTRRTDRAKADRLGDGRPYGNKGNSWGEYREGHKIATAAIAATGRVTRANAAAASARLAEAGVQISRSTLEQAAKQAPGESPVRMGDQHLKLPQGFVEEGRKIVLEMRELGVPNLKCMVMAELNAMIAGTRYEQLFEGGVITDRVSYSFLDRSDCFSADTKPLEDDRALWRHSQNARAQVLVWAEVIIDSKNASWAERCV